MSRVLSIAVAGVAAASLLAACASHDPGPLPASTSGDRSQAELRYRCDHDIAFTARFGDDSAVIDAGARGTETLLRDAGGVTPEQTVYSNTNAKVEFGLPPDGRGARLHWADPPLEASCMRD